MLEEVREALAASAGLLQLQGPLLGRPHADTLAGSAYANMKELRFKAGNGSEIWRAAFAFDPQRRACVLVAGDKQGQDEGAFYKSLIKTADRRFDMHLKQLVKAKNDSP